MTSRQSAASCWQPTNIVEGSGRHGRSLHADAQAVLAVNDVAQQQIQRLALCACQITAVAPELVGRRAAGRHRAFIGAHDVGAMAGLGLLISGVDNTFVWRRAVIVAAFCGWRWRPTKQLIDSPSGRVGDPLQLVVWNASCAGAALGYRRIFKAEKIG
jgi:hypothetical protein